MQKQTRIKIKTIRRDVKKAVRPTAKSLNIYLYNLVASAS